MSIFAFDVQYRETTASVGCVCFEAWTDEVPSREETRLVSPVAEYVSGQFWRRELPPLLEVLEEMERPDVIVVDGYVYLNAEGRPGLGKFLFDALEGQVPVVGVAKRAFRGSEHAVHVLRGKSRQALFVTAQGIEKEAAARHVQNMSGEHRIPTLFKRVDRIARDGLAQA